MRAAAAASSSSVERVVAPRFSVNDSHIAGWRISSSDRRSLVPNSVASMRSSCGCSRSSAISPTDPRDGEIAKVRERAIGIGRGGRLRQEGRRQARAHQVEAVGPAPRRPRSRAPRAPARPGRARASGRARSRSPGGRAGDGSSKVAAIDSTAARCCASAASNAARSAHPRRSASARARRRRRRRACGGSARRPPAARGARGGARSDRPRSACAPRGR